MEKVAFIEKKRDLLGKRIFDIIFSLLILTLFSPLFVLIALGIKCSSRGGAFFIQSRLGREGKPFDCWKFRTMHENAEELLERLLKENPAIKKEWDEKQKLRDDPRIFSLGKFLRKTSLDELPQFWNVLKGEMSVVGPRPYMVSQLEMMGELKAKILEARPGITGLWQTSGRSRTTFEERIQLDAEYVHEISFWKDIKFILKTIPSIFFNQNAC